MTIQITKISFIYSVCVIKNCIHFKDTFTRVSTIQLSPNKCIFYLTGIKPHPSSHPEIVPQRKTGLRLSLNHLLQNEELLIFSYFIGRNSSSKWHICKFCGQNKGRGRFGPANYRLRSNFC